MLSREGTKLIRISLVYWLCALYDIMPGVSGCFCPKRESRVVISVPGRALLGCFIEVEALV